MKQIFFLLLAGSLALLAQAPNALAAPSVRARANSPRLGDVVKDSYIVVLNKEKTYEVVAAESLLSRAGKKFSVGDTFEGYSGTFDQQTLQRIKLSPGVAYIEPNRIVAAADLIHRPTNNWNLHRVTHRESPPSDRKYFFNTNSEYYTKNCTSYAYVVDSGVYLEHGEFEGRASFGYNVIGGPNYDQYGHGTHVAGIIAGKTFGVAPKTRIISIKALDAEGHGTYAGVIKGLEWAIKDAASRGAIGRSVINMSLIGYRNQAMNDAVQATVKAGLVVVTAAGNYGDLAINYSPASAHDSLTVGAIDEINTRVPFSNYGITLDFWAPGALIRSAYIGGPNTTAVLSGTSMASPHVAGAVNYLQCLEGIKIPRMIRERLEELATTGQVIDKGNTSPDRIVFFGLL